MQSEFSSMGASQENQNVASILLSFQQSSTIPSPSNCPAGYKTSLPSIKSLLSDYKPYPVSSHRLDLYQSPSGILTTKSVHNVPVTRSNAVNNVNSTGFNEASSVSSKDSTLLEDDDEEMPRLQSLKSENDLYTPKWVRNKGSKKEGLCELCKPSKWLKLKDSAFWYHKQFYHGISSSNGAPFRSPINIQTVWVGDKISSSTSIMVHLITEGLCHHCNSWVPLFKNKKRFFYKFANSEAASSMLLNNDTSELKEFPELLPGDTFKIKVGRKESGQIFIPEPIIVSDAILTEVSNHERGQMTGGWFRHAHKCHQV